MGDDMGSGGGAGRGAGRSDRLVDDVLGLVGIGRPVLEEDAGPRGVDQGNLALLHLGRPLPAVHDVVTVALLEVHRPCHGWLLLPGGGHPSPPLLLLLVSAGGAEA